MRRSLCAGSLVAAVSVLLMVVTGAPAAAQDSCPGNLVSNSGFEVYSQCPKHFSQLSYANGWFEASLGTPDYFNVCAPCNGPYACDVHVPNHLLGFEWGVGPSNGYAGFVAYIRNPGGDDREYREYVETTLSSPLLPNTIYAVSFEVSLDDASEFAVSNIGAVFTKGQLYQATTKALNLTPDIGNTLGVITEKNGWTHICGFFHSGAGGQDHITFGNFATDANTTVQRVLNTSTYHLGYYLLDDVCVTVCSAAPSFAVHPQNQTVSFCEGATFSADGGCGVFYQWHALCFGVDIPLVNTPGVVTGVDTATLSLTPQGAVSFNGCGFYVTATNDCGTTASDGATLTIDPMPIVTPAQLSVCPPEPASLAVSFPGSDYKYQWVRRYPGNPRWSNVPRATGPVLDGDAPAFWQPTPEDCGREYACVITKAGCGSILSTPATIECCDCTPPPVRMALWLPFDEVSGSPAVTRNAVAYGWSGIPQPTGSGPSLYQGIYAGNSLFFDGQDDYVLVKHHFLVDISDGDLTIDAWVFVEGAAGAIQSIVDKRLERPGSPRGYFMFLQDDGVGNYRLGFQLADGKQTGWLAPPSSVFSGGEWHHVAVTVDRDDPLGGWFYVDGVRVGGFDPTGRWGSLSNPSPFTVGARSTTASDFFSGGIDEVEFFRRALGPDEIAAVYAANGIGKCKQFVEASTPTIFCEGAGSAVVGAYAFNFTPTPATFTGSFNPLNCPFTPPNFPVPATVVAGPWNWNSVWVTATKPAGMGANDTACYTAAFVAPGPTASGDGQIVNRPDIACSSGPATLVVLPLGDTADMTLGFGNAGIGSGAFAYRVEAIGPDGLSSGSLSINDASPGEVFEGEAVVPIGGEFVLPVEVRFDEVEALGVTTLLLSTDTDFDGVFEPAAAVALLCEVPDPDGCCPTDIGCDGVVDTRDLLRFLNLWARQDHAADWNGDGFVDTRDFIAYLQQWAEGC